MKRLGWILALFLMASPAWAVKKITVAQLQELLYGLQQARKTDAEVAKELMLVELSEELTRSTIDGLASSIPGPLSTQQIYVLEGRSAVLAPPTADLPSVPVPDADTQKALLNKAVDYALKTYAQLPHLTVTKTTARFQDNMKPPDLADPSKIPDKVWLDPRLGGQVIYYVGSTEANVESQNGAEMGSKTKDPTRWGANSQIIRIGSGPVLGAVLQEAQAAGNVNWLRWETVNGRQAAVFSFAVERRNLITR
ncbi:MAG: hypothetical protein ABSG51_00085 [Terracidiphilus sp.]|jgi:hypothetical protein